MEEWMADSEQPTFQLRPNHLGFTVSDLDRSVAFYRDLLGFTVAYERGEVTADYMPRLVGISGARLKVTGLDLAGLHLDLIQYLAPEGEVSPNRTCDVGNGHVGFTVDDLWMAYHRLSEAGVTFKSEPVSITEGPNRGGWAVYFTDPDGITLEMIQRASN